MTDHGYNKDPIIRVANTILSGIPLTDEVRVAAFHALHELVERRAWPDYHNATVKTIVNYKTEQTDAVMTAIKNWKVPATSGNHDVDAYYRDDALQSRSATDLPHEKGNQA